MGPPFYLPPSKQQGANDDDPPNSSPSQRSSNVLAWLHHPRRRGRNYLPQPGHLPPGLLLRPARLGTLPRCNSDMSARRLRLACHARRGPGRPAGEIMPIWDKDTLIDLAVYKQRRVRQYGGDADCAVPGAASHGQAADARPSRQAVAGADAGDPGEERAKQLSIQSGRRTFPSFAAAHGRTLDEVSKALGHAPGDGPQVSKNGRLTLPDQPAACSTNPLRHLDPLGQVALGIDLRDVRLAVAEDHLRRLQPELPADLRRGRMAELVRGPAVVALPLAQLG